MATKTEKKPDQENPNRIQDDYDQKFDEMTSPENYGREGEEPGSLAEQEEAPDNNEVDNNGVDASERQIIKQSVGDDSDDGDESADRESFQYTPGGKKKLSVRNNWKKLALGGGLVGLVGGTVALLYFFLPVLKVTHIFNNLEARFMGVAVNAIEARAEHLLSRYMRNYVFPSVRDCGRVVTIDCNPNFDPGRGITSNLYRNWSNARIEQKLFTNHGMLIEHRGGDNYSITTRRGQSIDVTGSTFEIGDLNRQDNVGAREVRRELKNILENETFWKRLMLRHSVRKLAATKYNIRWCVFACETRDSARETTYSALQRLKLKIIERTIGPFSDRLGLYLTCAVADCTNREFVAERSRIINRAIEELGEEEVERIITETGDRRLSQVLVDKIVSKVFGVTAGRGAAALVPIVGWIYAIDAVNQIDIKLYEGAISQYLADNVAAQYAEFYLTFRTNYDESIDNKLSLDEVGAQSQLLDGMEGSLVFQRDLSSGAATNTGFNLFNPVYAQSQPEQYLCADGNPIPEGELVCEERKVGKQSGYDAWRQSEEAALISGLVLGSYRCGPLSQIPDALSGDYCEPGSAGDVAWPVDSIVHQAFRLFGSVIDAISGFLISLVPDSLLTWFGEIFSQVAQFLLEFVFPYITPGTGPGRQVFDDLYAGVDVVGNEFAKGFEDPLTGEFVGLGGRRLTDEEVQENLAYYQEEQLHNFQNQSFLARVFSTEEPLSLVSRVAMTAPNLDGPSDLGRSLASLLNPVKLLAGISGAALAPTYAQANQYQGDPFGIHQYGYPVNDPAFATDPNEITPEACSPGGGLYDAWIAGAQEVAIDGQLVQDTANPCLLEYVTTNILGCWFTESNDCGVGNASIVAPDDDSGVNGEASPVEGLVSHPELGSVLSNGYFQMPPAPGGEYGFWSGTPIAQRCGSRALVDLIYTISVRWGQKYPNDRILVGDLNATGHLSHMNGVDWDIWTESSTAGGTFNTVAKATELARMLADTGIIKNIFYNVTSVQNDFNAYTQSNALSGVMSFEDGHFDHFHVRINDEYRGSTSTSCADTAASVLLPFSKREKVA